MGPVLLDANPIIATGGQIAAIIICAFLLVLFVLILAVNLALGFVLSWVREKSELIKMLRPTVDSVNKSSEATLRGVSPAAEENAIVRTIATVPGGARVVDQKVDQVSGRVANAVIEFRARTVQAQTVVQAFLLPGLNRQRIRAAVPIPELPASEVELEQSYGRDSGVAGEQQTAMTSQTNDVSNH